MSIIRKRSGLQEAVCFKIKIEVQMNEKTV